VPVRSEFGVMIPMRDGVRLSGWRSRAAPRRFTTRTRTPGTRSPRTPSGRWPIRRSTTTAPGRRRSRCR